NHIAGSFGRLGFMRQTLLLVNSLAFTQQRSTAAGFHVADFYTVSVHKSSGPGVKSEHAR
ncbi:MAG: hypothetical protein KA754_08230, partial [Corallincola sp.]|nr:hypothetical protein [Corallincola sp.]